MSKETKDQMAKNAVPAIGDTLEGAPRASANASLIAPPTPRWRPPRAGASSPVPSARAAGAVAPIPPDQGIDQPTKRIKQPEHQSDQHAKLIPLRAAKSLTRCADGVTAGQHPREDGQEGIRPAQPSPCAQIRSVGRSAQRYQGGRPRGRKDSRGDECAAGWISRSPGTCDSPNLTRLQTTSPTHVRRRIADQPQIAGFGGAQVDTAFPRGIR